VGCVLLGGWGVGGVGGGGVGGVWGGGLVLIGVGGGGGVGLGGGDQQVSGPMKLPFSNLWSVDNTSPSQRKNRLSKSYRLGSPTRE